jgi:site-specific DNA recombinase
VHQITGAVAEFERVKITERNRRGKLYRARCGEVVFSSVPFGYVRIPRRDGIGAHVEIDDSEAAVVRRVFDSYAHQGMTMRQIAKQLTLEAVPTPRGLRQWNRSTVAYMLQDEAYIGTLYYNRRKCVPAKGSYGKKGQRYTSTLRPREEWIPISVPPIIDSSTFQAVAKRVKDNQLFSRRNLRYAASHLLRRLVRCGRCGASCSAVSSGGVHNHDYYACWHKARGFLPDERCRQPHVRADLLDEMVWKEVRTRLKDPTLIMKAFRAQKTARLPGVEANETRERVNVQIKSANSELSRLLDAYQAGVIDLADLQKRRRLVDSKLEVLNREKVVLEKIAAEQTTNADIRANLDQFSSLVAANLASMRFEDKQKLLRLVLEKVIVSDQQVDLHYKIPLPNPIDPPNPKVSTQFDLRPTRQTLLI